MRRGILVVGLLLLPQLVFAQTNGVAVLDTTTDTWLPGFHWPYSEDVQISPDGIYGYVTNLSSDVLVFDAVTDTPIGAIPLADDSVGVAVTPDSEFVYVTTLTGAVSVIDVAHQAVVNTISSLFAILIVFSPDGSRAYGGQTVIDTATQTILGTLPTAGHFMAVSPTGDELWVSRNDDIAVIRTSDNTLLTTIDIPSGHPLGIVFSPDGATVYVGGTAALTRQGLRP